MQYSPLPFISATLPAERRPYLVSFDSGHECMSNGWKFRGS